MNELRRPSILLALADDRRAAEVVEEMVSLARYRRARVHLLNVLDEGRSPRRPLLGVAVDRFLAAGVQADASVRRPSGQGLGRDIAAVAREVEADLVVLASDGVGDVEAILHGSVSHQVLGATDLPVLLLRGQQIGVAERRILVAADGGDEDRLVAATALVALPGSEVVVLHVPETAAAIELAWVEPNDRARETAATVAESFRRSGFNASPDVRWGPVAYMIVETAAALDCDVIVLGSRPPSDLIALLIGSVAQQVIQRSDRPVLLARSSGRKRDRLAVVSRTIASGRPPSGRTPYLV